MSAVIEDHIMQMAARWYIRQNEAQENASQEPAFEAWLAASEQHHKAYQLVCETMGAFDSTEQLGQLSQAIAKKQTDARIKRGKKLAKLTSSLATVLVSVGVAWFGHTQYQDWQASPTMQLAKATAVAQMLTQTLEDGSVVNLDANSQINVRYYRQYRLVELQKGQAVFAVKRDPSRPFIVQTKIAKVTVLGTYFAVNQLQNTVRVSVDHGKVKVESTLNPSQQVTLQAGQVAEITNELAPHLINKNAADAFSFKDGKITFDQSDMSEVAQTLSRYVTPQVTTTQKGTSSPHISGVFSIKEAQLFLNELPKYVPVKVNHTAQATIIQSKSNNSR